MSAQEYPVLPPDDQRDPSQSPDEEAGESFGQWVALVVLLACWLAEASFGA
jgi:hypothetical protein